MSRLFLVGALVLLGACRASRPAPAPPSESPVRSLFVDGDVVAYEIRDGSGRVFGRAHSRFSDLNGGHRVTTKVALEPSLIGRPGDDPIEEEHVSTFDAELAPISYQRLSTLLGDLRIDFQPDGLAIRSGVAANFVERDRVRLPLLPPDDLMMLAIAIATGRVQERSISLEVFLPDALANKTWTAKISREPSGLQRLETSAGRVWLHPNGRVQRLESQARGWAFVAESMPKAAPELRLVPPRSYHRPPEASWQDRPVRVPVDGGALAGVLSIPTEAGVLEPESAPLLLFFSDAAPRDRHGFSAESDAGTWRLLDRLAKDGFLVLRLDDRGSGESVPVDPASRDERRRRIADGRAIFRWLRQLPELDERRVFSIGQGEGADIALELSDEPEVMAVVCIGAAPSLVQSVDEGAGVYFESSVDLEGPTLDRISRWLVRTSTTAQP